MIPKSLFKLPNQGFLAGVFALFFVTACLTQSKGDPETFIDIDIAEDLTQYESVRIALVNSDSDTLEVLWDGPVNERKQLNKLKSKAWNDADMTISIRAYVLDRVAFGRDFTYYADGKLKIDSTEVSSRPGGTVKPFDSIPKPLLSSPKNQAVDQALSLILRWKWDADSAAASFVVYVGDSINQDSIGATQETSLSLGGLKPGKTYFWKVIALQNGDEAESEVFSFGTLQPSAVSFAYPSPAVFLQYKQADVLKPLGAGSELSEYRVHPALPEGLKLDSASGAISGVPVQAKEAQAYTISAESRGGRDSTQLVLSVEAASAHRPTLELKGSSADTVVQGDIYVDPGARCTDEMDGDLTSAIEVSGSVPVDSIGIFVLEYRCRNSGGSSAATVQRRVNVKEAPDTTPPNLDLIGLDSMQVEKDENFQEPGYKCVDERDGDITESVQRTGTIDNSKLGVYHITYKCTDAAENNAQIVRWIEVVAGADTLAPVLEFEGPDSMRAEVGTTLALDNAVCVDSRDGKLEVQMQGDVDFNVPGTYYLTYRCIDKAGNSAPSLKRTVVIYLPDRTPPKIKLLGDSVQIIPIEEAYVDPGAQCTDEVDGKWEVKGTGHVNSKSAGNYYLSYVCEDSSGNVSATISRRIQVQKADTEAPVILLLGNAEMTILEGSAFQDPGAICTDDKDADRDLTPQGSVNTSEPAVYVLRYNCTDAAGKPAVEVIRRVTVDRRDAQAPTIELIGMKTVTLVEGDSYEDSKALCKDDKDPEQIVESIDQVKADKPGTYYLTYRCTDSSGKKAIPVVRTVIVETADKAAPVLTLIGSPQMTIIQDDLFTDPGALCTDDKDADRTLYSQDAVLVGTPGEYRLSYNCRDAAGKSAATVYRDVIVEMRDVEAPIIALVGANPIKLKQGDAFADPGAICSDDKDSDRSIYGEGTVDSQTPGKYLLTYRCTDQSGKEAQPVTRQVAVEKIVTGLVAHWSFDDGVGTSAADVTGNGQDGTIHGATWTTGIKGGALELDGVNDWIEVVNSSGLGLESGLSISVWYKANSLELNKEHALVSKGGNANNGYHLIVQQYDFGFLPHAKVGKEGASSESRTTSFTTEPNTQNWQHLVLTYDGETSKLFLNGNEEASKVVGGPAGTYSKFAIGRLSNYSRSYFHGKLDEIKIFDYAMGPEQVIAEFNSTKP